MATTISISEETKETLKNFGRTGDSYDDVIRKICDFTARDYLRYWLYNDSESIAIDEAIAEAKKKWPE